MGYFEKVAIINNNALFNRKEKNDVRELDKDF